MKLFTKVSNIKKALTPVTKLPMRQSNMVYPGVYIRRDDGSDK